MSTLENLTAKILADSEAEVARTLQKAEEEAAAVRTAAQTETARETEKLLADAKTEAARQAEQLVEGARLAARDAALDAKQRILNKVFAEALARLNAMDKAAFTAFLVSSLKAAGADGGELLLPERYGLSAGEINAAMGTTDSKAGGFRISTTGRGIDGGFVLCQGGIEQNNTFDSLVAFYRYELESDVLKALE